jgi:aldehyde:ferredoxin oxidoreductase
MIQYGYAGKFAEVNLTDRTVTVSAADDLLLKKYLGGQALGAFLLLQHCRPGTAPYDAGNPLIFVTGPLSGSGFPATSRAGVLTRSPLTGGFLDSYCGGDFGWRLKRAGFDVLIVKGKSECPVALHVENGSVEFRPADDLWGKTTPEVVAEIRREFGHGKDRSVTVVSIGPAGENGVRFADLVNDDRHFGRGGAGAVMGSKKLKAISVVGDRKPPVADETAFKAVSRRCREKTFAHPLTGKEGAFPRVGTMMTLDLTQETGTLPARNWQENTFEKAESVSGKSFSRYILRTRSCLACPVGCSRDSRAEAAGVEWTTQGPEYETMYSFGSNCGIEDPAIVIAANKMCNDLGLDTISCGVAIGFAMECNQLGLLSGFDTGDLDISFGNGPAVLELIHRIADRTGIGRLLSDGVKRASEKIPGSGSFAMHVKGLELPGYDPRGMKGQGLTYAVADRGGCHLRSNTLRTEIIGIPKPYDRYAYEDKAAMVRTLQLINAASNSLITCVFGTFAIGMEDYAEALSALLGLPVTENQLMRVAEQALNMARIFNAREGFSRADDALPERLLTLPSTRGPSRGLVVERDRFEKMLDEYYELMGWNRETGIPTAAKLRALELAEFAIEPEKTAQP